MPPSPRESPAEDLPDQDRPDEESGGGSLADVVGAEPGGRVSRRATLTVAVVSALLGVALVAAAPVVWQEIAAKAGPTAGAGAGLSQTPGSSSATAAPTAASGDLDEDRAATEPSDDAGSPSTDGGAQGGGGRTDGGTADGDRSGDEATRAPGDGSGGADAAAPGDAEGGAAGGSAGDGTADGGSAGGTDAGSDPDPDPGTDDRSPSTGGAGDGSGSGSSGGTGAGSGGSGYVLLADAKPVNIVPSCYPGTALDLDTWEQAATDANGRYELEFWGCAWNVQGQLTTALPTANLGRGTARPGPRACADAARGGAALAGESVDAGSRLCTTTGAGRVAFILIKGYNNSYTGDRLDGSLDAVVTTWKKS